MSRITIILFIVGLSTMTALTVSAQELEFSGDVSVVSNYVWRGVSQSGQAELQGTVGAAYKALSFGVWYSSVSSDGGTSLESDPYIELSLPTGSLSSAIGAVVYTYDFKTYNDNADYEYELYGSLGYGVLGVSGYFVPSQSSTDSELNDSAYWLETSVTYPAIGVDWGVMYGVGTYSSRFLEVPKEDAVSMLGLSASKSINESLSIGWNYSIGLDDDLDDILWVSLALGF